jgi:hypothetical protein
VRRVYPCDHMVFVTIFAKGLTGTEFPDSCPVTTEQND